MDVLITFLEKVLAHFDMLLWLLAAAAVGVIAIVLLCCKFRKSPVVMKIWSKRQMLFNLFVVVVLLAGIVFAMLVLLEFREYRDLSLKDLQDVTFYEEQVNLYDPAGCEDFFYDYDGSKVEAQNGSVMSNWIPCSAGQKLARNGIATSVVCYFDADKNFIQRVDCYGEEVLTVPDNEEIAFVRMAVQMSDDLKIVYGEQIADISIAGGYYSIPGLKVSDRNLLGEFAVIESPDGKQWKITVDNDGNLSAENVTGTMNEGLLPADFPEYEITGSSISDEDYLISMYGATKSQKNYIFVMSAEGRIKWYKQVPFMAFNFRKIQYPDGTIRYAYQQTESIREVENINGGMYFTHIVLMDENFQVINDNIRPVAYGSITEETNFCESHDYKILGDNHYLLTSVTLSTVDNIPGMEGTQVQVVNAIIQEQKDGQVVMQWESIEHPELYSASLTNNEYAAFTAGTTDEFTDYVHLNAIAVDPQTYDLLISCRSVGLMKIDRETGEILWIMGRGQNDIQGLEQSQIGLLQHDVRYLDDGSFTIFDNSGGQNSSSRVCRYWIDEDTKTLVRFQEYPTEYYSSAMGSAELLDEETDTYTIVYGMGVADMAFEERNFSTNTVNMRLKFTDGQVLYRVFRGVETTPVQ